MLLSEKRGIITGAASGIGRGAVARFVQEGAVVAAWDRDTSGLAESVKGLPPDRVRVFRVDISREDDVVAAVAHTVEWLGRVDFLFNNAGVMENASFMEETLEGWSRLLDVDLTGTFLVSKYVMPHITRPGGSIINMGSVTGLLGHADLAAYSAAKAGVIGLTRAMAMDCAPLGVRVNSINPGTIDTPILHRFLEQHAKNATAAYQAFVDLHPLGRLGTPDDIAKAAAWLASDYASFVTGATIVVDGGYSIRGSQPRG